MIDLSNYILEKFKISKDIEVYDDDKYYIFYFKDIKKLKNLKNLEEIKPIATLDSSDIRRTMYGPEINIKGRWLYDDDMDMSPNYDPGDDGEPPEKGDLVFNIQNKYFLYRPSIIEATCSSERTPDEDYIFIGNKRSIIYTVASFCRYQDVDTDIVEINSYINKNF